jgi:hypothetical protein
LGQNVTVDVVNLDVSSRHRRDKGERRDRREIKPKIQVKDIWEESEGEKQRSGKTEGRGGGGGKGEG